MLTLALSIIPSVFAFLVIYGALSDLSTFRIPNWVSYGLVGLFALQTFLVWLNTPYMPSLGGLTIPPSAVNALVALLVFIVSMVFWQMRVIGGGDAKYLTATSLWMGIANAAAFFILLTVLAVVMALALKFASRWGFLVHASRLPRFVKRLFSKVADNQLPYGFPIGIATLILLPQIFSF